MTKFITAAEARNRASQFRQIEQVYEAITKAVDNEGKWCIEVYSMPIALNERLTKDGYKIRSEQYTPSGFGFGFENGDKEPDLQTRWVISW